MQFPSFKHSDQNGTIWQRRDLGDGYAVVFIYPRAMTPGCTVEARDFNALQKEFTALGVRVVGLSRDEPARQKKFAEKENLTIPLLADPDATLMTALDAWKEKNMYGKKVWGAVRSTFLVSPKGAIVHAWRDVKVPGHVDEVLAKVRGLTAK